MNDYLPEYYSAQGTDRFELLYDDRELDEDRDLQW
jgi:hypothetical protein